MFPEEIDDLLSRACFAQPRKDPRDAVDVGISIKVRQGIDGEGDIQPVLMGLLCGRLDADARGDDSDHDLRGTQLLQMLVEARVRERSPRPLRHRMVSRLPVQLRDEIGPSGKKLRDVARLFRPARGRTADRDEYHRQAVATECVSQRTGGLHDLVGRVDGG